jgi:ABC-2 type transport system permease protein
MNISNKEKIGNEMKNSPYSPKNNSSLRQTIRITWAIAAKDILEALKNKNTIAIILTSLLMLVFYYYMPILESRDESPRVRIYDAGESILVPLLENSEAVDVRTYPSQEIVFEALRNNSVPVLGLVIPAGFDAALESGDEAQLQGYVMSWVDHDNALDLQRLFEQEIASLTGQPVPIQMAGNQVSLEPDSHGVGSTAAIAIVFMVVMIGLTMIPHLMLEEKSSRTMDVLLVSPASAGNLVAGKAIVGLFYCLLTAAIALLVFNFVVVHWWLALLAVVFGALLTISLGLWLGTIIESRAQLTMWAWVFILPLLLPVFLTLMGDLFPEPVVKVLQILPTAVVLNLLRISFSSSIPLSNTLLMLAWLAAWAGAGLLLVTWIVRRQERQESGPSAARQLAENGMKPVAEVGGRWFGALFSRFSRRAPQPIEPQTLDASFDLGSEPAVDLPRKRSSLRIIWTVASKDIYATLRNKLALSIMLGSLFVVASSTIPRMLLMNSSDPAAIVYDPGRSTILRGLAASDDIRLGVTDSLEEMQEIISGSPELRIGLVVPEDFDSLAGSGEIIELEAYVVHWADVDKVEQWVTFFQEQIGGAAWSSVQINLSETRLYPPADLQGGSIMFSLLVTIVLLTIGVALVPLLLVEERTAHTLEVLLVSPARVYEVVIGKALAGGFYCLLAVIVVFFLNRFLVVNWGVALLAMLLGGIFAVSVGLLVGVLSENPTTVGLWSSMLLLGLLGLTMLNAFAVINWPPLVGTLLDYLPTNAITELLGFSMAGEFPLSQLWLNSAALLIAALVVFGLLTWRLRVADR